MSASKSIVTHTSHCRFCATEMAKCELMDLTKENIFERYKLILTHLKIDLDLSDNNNLPKMACLQCHKKCLETLNFFFLVKRSQHILVTIYDVNTNNTGLIKIESDVNSPIKSENQDCEDFNSNTFNSEEVPVKEESPGEEETVAVDETAVTSKQADFVEVNINNCNINTVELDANNQHSSENGLNICNSESEIPENNRCDLSFENEDVNRIAIKTESPDIGEEIDENMDFDGNNTQSSEIDTGPHSVNMKVGDSYQLILDDDIKKEEMSWSKYPWSCSRCHSKFNAMDDVRAHSISKHKQCYGFGCADCSDVYNRFSIFVEHVRSHREHLRLFCQYCNKDFKNPRECFEHTLYHWETQIICEMCGQICDDAHNLVKHQRKNKKKTLQKQSKTAVQIVLQQSFLSWKDYEWTCLDCFRVLPDIESLRKHVRDVHYKCFAMKCADCLLVMLDYAVFVKHVHQHRPYLRHYCQYCNRYISDLSDMNTHVNDHLTQEINCHGCGDSFENQELLKKHIVDYSAPTPNGIIDKSVSCDICFKKFIHISNLKLHKLNHPKVDGMKAKFVCHVCGKSFKTTTNHKAHLLLHKDKTEICEICNGRFSSKRTLRSHAQTHLKDRKFICDLCGKQFKCRGTMVGHVKIHTDEKPYACIVCKKRFRNKAGLKTHSAQHTDTRPYKCTLCDKTFNNSGNCNKHMIRIHGKPFYKSKITSIGKLAIDNSVEVDEKAEEWLSKVIAYRKRAYRSDEMAEDVTVPENVATGDLTKAHLKSS